MILFFLTVTFLTYSADDNRLFYAPEGYDWVKQQVALYAQKRPKKEIAFGVSIPVGGYIIEINEYAQENGQQKWSNITITSPHLAASLQAIHIYKPQWQKMLSHAYKHDKK